MKKYCDNATLYLKKIAELLFCTYILCLTNECTPFQKLW